MESIIQTWVRRGAVVQGKTQDYEPGGRSFKSTLQIYSGNLDIPSHRTVTSKEPWNQSFSMTNIRLKNLYYNKQKLMVLKESRDHFNRLFLLGVYCQVLNFKRLLLRYYWNKKLFFKIYFPARNAVVCSFFVNSKANFQYA